MPKITLIAAIAKGNNCIGSNNSMPWHLPEDFKFFREYTAGKPVVMGRKTWESLPKRPLPGRRNIVVTRQPDYAAEGAETVLNLHSALALCGGVEEIVIMGGAQIYAEALPAATDLRITEIDLAVEGDAFFPAVDAGEWQASRSGVRRAQNGLAYEFVHYRRREGGGSG